MKTLYARFPEKWPDGSSSGIDWVLSGSAPVLESGVADSVSDLPKAESLTVVLPYQAVSMTEIELPDGREEILQKAAVNASADIPITTSGQIHIALGGKSGDGKRAVIFVDKSWLRGILEALRLRGTPPAAVIVDAMACPLDDGHCSIVWSGHDGFMLVSETLGFTLDCGDGSKPPAALAVFIESDASTRMDLYVEDESTAPDISAWGEKFQSRIRMAGRWDWRKAVASNPKDPVNLLKGEFAPPSGLESAIPALKTTLLLLIAMIVLWISGSFAEWRTLKQREKDLRARINGIFSESFPKAGPPLEPLSQMEKALAAMKERSPVWRKDGFVQMMSVAMPAIGDGRIVALKYEGKSLEMTVVVKGEEMIRQMVARLSDNGISAKTTEKTKTRDGMKTKIILSLSENRRPVHGDNADGASPFGS